eukprot:c11583_g2_i2.p1 GENE.c11583_g2_i2~~c11583_g2_i2.p1  ORF type:complete len:486 (-),score=124.96 c11583_g2_i2:183-1640(-)
MPNFLEWTATQLACARIGVALVNLNPGYRSHELNHALNLVGCKGILLCPEFGQTNYLEILSQLCPELSHCNPGHLSSTALPHLRHVIHVGKDIIKGTMRFEDLCSLAHHHHDIAQVAKHLHPSSPINIQFTSGTTGLPKAATLTHHNIVNNGYFVGECQRLQPSDRICLPVPLYHCFGTVLGNLAAITHGSSIVFPSPTFNPHATLQAVQDFQCTALYGVPTMFIAELSLASFSQFNLRSLRTGIMAGSPCPIEIMRRVTSQMNLSQITIAYGMTETSPVSFQSNVDDPLDLRCATVGTIHPHVECKVVDEQGQTVRVGVPGELLTRGYSVMWGYWANEKATKAALVPAEDGGAPFFRTGDLATIDSNGYCRIVGRLSDMIIRGGENIYPREVEEFLFTHPNIKDVAVIGVEDSKYGEAVCAWVVSKNGDAITREHIKEFCKNKIAHFKIPAHVFTVKQFPMTVTGKIQKFIMRQESNAMIKDGL